LPLAQLASQTSDRSSGTAPTALMASRQSFVPRVRQISAIAATSFSTPVEVSHATIQSQSQFAFSTAARSIGSPHPKRRCSNSSRAREA
jgi:hypothetical protein